MGEEPEPQFGPVQFYTFTFLYTEPPVLDANALVERLNRDIRTELVSSTEHIVGVAHPDYRVQMKDAKVPTLTQFASYMKPFDAEEFTAALEQTWDWDEADEITRHCQHRVLMGDVIGSGLEYKDRYRVISADCIAFADMSRPAAIHWQVAGCMVDPARLGERLNRRCNVRLFNIEGDEGRTLMDTCGLVAFGLPDLQLDFVGLDPEVVAGWLYTVAGYLFEKGDVIKDGNTIDGAVSGERWRCQHSFSLVWPRRHVLDIDAGAHSGFKSAD